MILWNEMHNAVSQWQALHLHVSLYRMLHLVGPALLQPLTGQASSHTTPQGDISVSITVVVFWGSIYVGYSYRNQKMFFPF